MKQPSKDYFFKSLLYSFVFMVAVVLVPFILLLDGRAMSCEPSRGQQDLAEDSSGSSAFNDRDFRQHVDELKKRLPETDTFHICISKPFVVIGNESRAKVEQRAEDTVGWAVKRLQQEYFPAVPKKIIDIWLFKDK